MDYATTKVKRNWISNHHGSHEIRDGGTLRYSYTVIDEEYRGKHSYFAEGEYTVQHPGTEAERRKFTLGMMQRSTAKWAHAEAEWAMVALLSRLRLDGTRRTIPFQNVTINLQYRLSDTPIGGPLPELQIQVSAKIDGQEVIAPQWIWEEEGRLAAAADNPDPFKAMLYSQIAATLPTLKPKGEAR